VDLPKKLAVDDIKTTVPPDRRILEVGFGTGEVLKRLLRAGYSDIFGTELSRNMVERLAAERPYLRERLFQTDDPRAVDGAEVVLCFEVLEHVKDPQELARRIPGSVLYASVPNPNRWYHALTGRYEGWDYPPNHLHRFTRDDLQRLLVEAGYSSVSIETMPMRAVDVLMPFTRRVNVADYDQMRASRTWRRTAAWPLARVFRGMGYEGGSLYVKALR
jgi:SAM-dependent methyltransferase